MSSPALTLTKEDLQEILLAVVKAGKQPTEEEAEKLKEAKARAEKNKADFVKMVEQEQQAKAARQASCGHRKENGRFSTGGQVIGGRFALLLCSHCQKPWYKVFSPETMAQLNSGDLVLFGADPSGWDDVPPQV